MCAWLGGVTVGVLSLALPTAVGHRRPPRDADCPDPVVFDASDQTYGYRRVHADLVAEGTAPKPAPNWCVRSWPKKT